MASGVSIYIKRDERIMGPYTEEQTVARYHRGEFRDNDLAMIDGVTGWHPLATYIVEETAEAPAGFVAASAATLPSSPRDAPTRFEMPEERRPEELFALGKRSFALVNPLGAAWALLGLGVVVMFFSRWPWTLWVPLILAAICLAVQQLARRNYVHAGPLLAVALLAPWFIYSQWLAPRPVPVAHSAAPAAAAPAEPAATPLPPRATPAPAPARAAVVESKPAPVAATPAPAPPQVIPEARIMKGDRVTLTRDTMLNFNGKPYRLGKQGEEFDVLATQGDKLFLQSSDVTGRIIAVTAPFVDVRLLTANP